MYIEFSDIYPTLNRKEKAAVLYAVKSYHYMYPNIHLGHIPFLNSVAVILSMNECLVQSSKIENNKLRPSVPSILCERILKKLYTKFNSTLIILDELKVFMKGSNFHKDDRYIIYVPILKGRISCKVELKYHSKNKFYITIKSSYLSEAVKQLTYTFGLFNQQ